MYIHTVQLLFSFHKPSQIPFNISREWGTIIFGIIYIYVFYIIYSNISIQGVTFIWEMITRQTNKSCDHLYKVHEIYPRYKI